MADERFSESSPTKDLAKDPLLPAKIIYGLYAVGFFLPLLTLGGVIYAYITRGGDAVLDSHLTFQIRTFWVGLVVSIIGGLLAFVVIGYVLLLACVIWVLARLISGFLLTNKGKAIPDPTTLAFTVKEAA